MPGYKNWYNTTIDGKPTIVFMRKIEHVTPSQQPDSRERTTHSYMSKEEVKEAIKQESTKPKDPCEKQLECIQDKESQEVEPELNWKHKDKIDEAEGPIIDPKREWTEGYIPTEEIAPKIVHTVENAENRKPYKQKSDLYVAAEVLDKKREGERKIKEDQETEIRQCPESVEDCSCLYAGIDNKK